MKRSTDRYDGQIFLVCMLLLTETHLSNTVLQACPPSRLSVVPVQRGFYLHRACFDVQSLFPWTSRVCVRRSPAPLKAAPSLRPPNTRWFRFEWCLDWYLSCPSTRMTFIASVQHTTAISGR